VRSRFAFVRVARRTTCGPTCPSYNVCLALPSHHQDASFTTSAALYGRTVASRRRHVAVRQAARIDRHRLAQGSSHAVELGDELLVIVAPGGRSSASRHDELAVRSSSRLVIATSCGRCCGVASFGGACASSGNGHAAPSVLRRGGCLCPCQTGLLVFVAALGVATVQRAQRAAAPRWAGGGGLPHQPAPLCPSGGRSAGTRA